MPPTHNKSGKQKRLAEETWAKIEKIVRHNRNVQDNCLRMARKLIEQGEIDLGRKLAAAGLCHDQSKFFGIEWKAMAPDTPCEDESSKLKMRAAIEHHGQTNTHHPEYWDGIEHMNRLALAEMVCDWKARSEEFGTSLQDHIENKAAKRFGFTTKDPIYKTITELANLICEKPSSRSNKRPH